MLETHEYEGYWWLPTDADGPEGFPLDQSKMRSGNLTISRGVAHLKVLGSFGHDELGRSEDSVKYSILPAPQERILGFTAEGKCITLDDCGITDAPMHFPGIPRTTYRAGVVFVGAWFENGEAITFNEIAIQTSELATWTGARAFQNLRQGKSGTVSTTFRKPAPIKIPLDFGEAIQIKFESRFGGIPAVPTGMTFSQVPSLHLRYAMPRGFGDVKVSVNQLRNFFALALGRPETVESVIGYRDDLLAPKTTHPQPIRIYWRLQHNPEPRGRPPHPVEMLFSLSQFRRRMPKMLRTWFGFQDRFEPVLNLYFAMLYHPDMYWDVQFLTYAQAIETYDFRRRDPHDLNAKDYSKRVKATVAAAPKDWREWLSMKLIGNYKVLDQRIRAVLDECPEVSGKIVGVSAEERDAFVKRFKDSRNWYTHYTPRLKRKAATKPGELYYLINQVRTIIEMSLLREIGFSCNEIDTMFTQRGRQRYFELQHWKRVADEEAQGSDRRLGGAGNQHRAAISATSSRTRANASRRPRRTS